MKQEILNEPSNNIEGVGDNRGKCEYSIGAFLDLI